MPTPNATKFVGVPTLEALSGNPDRFDRYAGAEIRSMMDKLPGWRRAKGRIKTVPVYGRQRYYERTSPC